MNDLKNSSNGLLVITTRVSMKSDQLAKLRQTIEPLADELGLKPVALCDGLEVRQIVDYTPLLARLCDAVEALVAQGQPPEVSEAQIAPQALNARQSHPLPPERTPSGLNSRPEPEHGDSTKPAQPFMKLPTRG